ncbi:Putative Zinc finger C2H2-type [Septoria linicola]|uniref:Zinc finger C2H2-type n=1 Tax=Septoria linicola TaxID=215465 RepID=A0A9Q9AKI4_9PEZI|nr:Putative Zinc finger C2H2-type [Septoria linicola]
MSATINPRRRPARTTDASVTLIDSFQNMSIRKGDTFHPNSTTSNTSFWDPLESRLAAPAMPMRSSTSPKSLEDLLIGAGERRVTQLLDRVEKAVAAQSKVALGNVLSEPEVLPVPTFVVDRTAEQERGQKTRTRHHSHSSDSGIGSSIADSTESIATAKNSTRTAIGAPSSPGSQSFSSISEAADEERCLSKYAAEQIHKHIVQPILKETALSDFHDLIKSVPIRIGDKEIKTLRDLEKTLIFLAPDYSHSPSKYLRFCERTIRVLHTTVTTLHESDQRAPTDRPYTQGYFFDLVEQIRRYATILAATRDHQAKHDKPETMDESKDTGVSLYGGLSHNGKPAELVHTTPDGKVISLATGKVISDEDLASAAMKRPALEVDEDDALRSMARRKKNAKPEIHTCELCNKEFKRPCDLTKHVKTHERPWKCSEVDCKYHEFGWPTEKERDRHVNDKHSSAPSLYHCMFKPCPYTSKRESNCKQHMEKAHGWDYVRSKSNGKGKATKVVRLPQGSVPPSPSSTMLTPLTPIAPSPSVHSYGDSSRHSSMAPPPLAGPSNYNTPGYGNTPASEFLGHFNMDYTGNFDFNDLANFPTSAFPITPAMSEDRRTSASMSSTSGMHYESSAFGEPSPNQFTFNENDFALPENWQSYTPDSSIAGPGSSATHVSPATHMEQTFTEDAFMEDKYEAFTAGPAEDFTLFGNPAPAATAGDMFPNLGVSSWGAVDNLGTNFGAPPALPNGNTNAALAELFPELTEPANKAGF